MYINEHFIANLLTRLSLNEFCKSVSILAAMTVSPLPGLFWATVCKTVRPMLSDRCLSVLSVTFVHCGQTVGRIKMKLGMQVGLVPGNNVLDEDPTPPPPKGHSPQFLVRICCGHIAA